MQEIYLDNNATTKPLPGVVDAVADAMTRNYGNASSPHGRGDIANRELARARQSVAQLFNCADNGVVFTSGGTEANNLVLVSYCKPNAGHRLITTRVEHASVLNIAQWLSGQGTKVDYLDVDHAGRIDLDQLDGLLAQPAELVSIQWANSETGTIQPIREIGLICDRHDTPLHVDAAQAVGRLPIDIEQYGVNVLTMTAHKIHGPQGVGAIIAKSLTALSPFFHGGAQEASYRPGTENLPGIVGFGKAAAMRNSRLEECVEALKHMRDTFEDEVCAAIPQAQVNGCLESRVPNSTNILFPGADGMAMMAQLDSAGVCCSLTSACTGARPVPSHVLMAMGLSEDEAYSSLRFSFSVLNSMDEARSAAGKVQEAYFRLANVEKTMQGNA